MGYEFKAPRRLIKRVFIHCSATDHPNHDNVKWVRELHVKQNRWSDIGYHFFIRKSGRLEIGRDIDRSPAAQAGHNLATIAICLSGLDVKKFTESQFETLRSLCDDIHAELPLVTFHGHNEVANKLCPVFDHRKVLGLNAKGELTA